MLTALAILGGVFVYTQIGRLISGKAWGVWHKGERSLGSALLFPASFMMDAVGLNSNDLPIESFKSERNYLLASSLFWPARLVWPFFAFPLFGVLFSVSYLCELGGKSKSLRNLFGKIGRTMLFLGTPIYKIARFALLTLHEPEEALKSLGNGAKSIGKWLVSRKIASLSEKTAEDVLPAMREELNGLLAEQEVVAEKVLELQQKICAEEARRMGTYREAPKLESENLDDSAVLSTDSRGPG